MQFHRHGFTLTELLVAIVVGSILLLAASSFLGSSTDGYSRIAGSMATEREARALTQEIADELLAAHFHKDMLVERDSSSWVKGRIGFLTRMPVAAQAKSQQIGDLCAVHYYVRDLIIGGRATRCVMRGFRDSKAVFDGLRSDSIPALFAPDPVVDEPIAMRVLSFDVRPQVYDSSGRWADAPLPLVNSPDAVKVRLVVARPSISGRLKTTADWDGVSASIARDLGNPAEADRNRHLQIYESVIPFAPNEVR